MAPDTLLHTTTSASTTQLSVRHAVCSESFCNWDQVLPFFSISTCYGFKADPTRPDLTQLGPHSFGIVFGIVWLQGSFFRHTEALVLCSLVERSCQILSVHFHVNRASNYVLMFSSTAATSVESSPEGGLVVILIVRGHLITPKYFIN